MLRYELVGGTFSSKADGAVGSQFEKDGAVGGVSSLSLYLPSPYALTDQSSPSCVCLFSLVDRPEGQRQGLGRRQGRQGREVNMLVSRPARFLFMEQS